MLSTIKSLISLVEPKMLALISLAPFAVGVILGYVLRTPISWALDIVKLIMKI